MKSKLWHQKNQIEWVINSNYRRKSSSSKNLRCIAARAAFCATCKGEPRKKQDIVIKPFRGGRLSYKFELKIAPPPSPTPTTWPFHDRIHGASLEKRWSYTFQLFLHAPVKNVVLEVDSQPLRKYPSGRTYLWSICTNASSDFASWLASWAAALIT